MLKCSWKQVCRIMLLGPGWRMGLGYRLQKHQSAGLAFQTRKSYTCTEPSPESHSHAFSSWFGCKQLWDYSYPVVSQRLVNSWVQSEMDPLLFPLCPLSRALISEELVPRSCTLGMPGWEQFGVDGSMDLPQGWGCGALCFPQQGCR